MVDKGNRLHMVKGRASHAGQAPRPFQCQWHEGCSKSFNRKSDLQRHYRIHTNERPYACDYKPCEKTFIQRSALTVHRRTHTGDKPHKCPYVGCGKCFSDSSSLARHRRIHTNDKPYICKNPHCRKAFCRKTTMTKHFRKEHPADSLNDEEDAEYTDIDESEGDASEQAIKLSREGSTNTYHQRDAYRDTPPAPSRASTYSTDLWSLPGQSAQTPTSQSLHGSIKSRCESAVDQIKLDRSLSRTPQRNSSDSLSGAQEGDYMQGVSSTLPDTATIPSSAPRQATTDMPVHPYLTHDNGAAVWPSHPGMADSPTSLTSSSSGIEPPQAPFATRAFHDHSMGMPPQQHLDRYPSAQHPVSELQAVEGLVLNESSSAHYGQGPVSQTDHHPYHGPPSQQTPSSLGQRPQTQSAYDGNVNSATDKTQSPAYDGEISSGQMQAQSLPYTMGELAYQEPQILPPETMRPYNVQVHHRPQYNPYAGFLYNKDPKDDIYTQMPSNIYSSSWAT